MQDFLVEGHLQPVFFPRGAAGIFFGFAAFEFYQFVRVLCQQVHAPLQAEGLAEEGRFELHFRGADVDAGLPEMGLHGLADVVELFPALVEEVAADVRQGGVGQG